MRQRLALDELLEQRLKLLLLRRAEARDSLPEGLGEYRHAASHRLAAFDRQREPVAAQIGFDRAIANTLNVADGALGEIRSVHADMGVHFPVDHTSRLYDPALGGGALLDLGVYAVWFAHLVLGVPENVVAWGLRTATGVDAQSVTVMRAGAAQGVVTTTLRSLTPTGASITGSAARIDWDARMPQPGGFTLVDTATREVLRFDDMTGIELQHGMCRQAAWMARNVADGLLQSPRHPLGTSVEVLDIIDSARRQLSDSPVVAD